MTDFVIKDMDPSLRERLEQSAAVHGVTPEEEAKKILNQWLPPGESCHRRKSSGGLMIGVKNTLICKNQTAWI
ncbi:MAG: hypothetical protein ACOX5R_15950 [bacterium]|jgi:plasmid stability protein